MTEFLIKYRKTRDAAKLHELPYSASTVDDAIEKFTDTWPEYRHMIDSVWQLVAEGH